MIRPDTLACFEGELANFYGKASVDGKSPTPSLNGPATPTLPHLGTTSNPHWTWGDDGKVRDGRDRWMTHLTWRAYYAGCATAEAIAARVWVEFQRTTELSRPKRDGKRAWRYADALAKARYILKRRPTRRGPLEQHEGFWTAVPRAAFTAAVNAIAAEGGLAPATRRVSHAMLDHVRGDSTCFASPSTLARETGLAVRTVKKARAELLKAGYWRAANNKGGKLLGAEYTPNPDLMSAVDGIAHCIDLPPQATQQIGHPKPVWGGSTSPEGSRDASPANPTLTRKRKYSGLSTSHVRSAPTPLESRAPSDKHTGNAHDVQRDDAPHDGGDA